MQTCTFTFIVTKACQLQCKYCYLVGKNLDERMSLDVAQKALDYIFASNIFVDCEKVVFDFIGGEPLLEINLIDDIMNYAYVKMQKERQTWFNNHEIRITTNGLLYSTPSVQEFIKKYHKHTHISISIDGNKIKNDTNRVFPNGDGSYDKIIENVKLWIKQFPEEGTKMVVAHDDLYSVCDSLKHLVNIGIKYIDVNPVVENVWMDGDDKILEQELIDFADFIIDYNLWENLYISTFDDFIGNPLTKGDKLTPCGSMQFSVDAQGKFYSCLRFAKYSLRSKMPLIIGNVDEGISYNKLRPFELLYNDVILPVKCQDCEIASGCKWCPAEAYDSSLSNSIFEKTIFSCKMHKAKVRAKNYYWNKLNNKNIEWTK